jgi:ABC-type branched-subunit amino acid transport system ATPase component
LPFQAPFIAQTALRIDAKAVKFRRENCLLIWLVWLDFLSAIELSTRFYAIERGQALLQGDAANATQRQELFSRIAV